MPTTSTTPAPAAAVAAIPGQVAPAFGPTKARRKPKEKAATSAGTAVNVASVPQRSPFRYPGGKTWLVPQARLWLKSQPTKPTVLVEPFLGGGSISLLAAAEDLVDHVYMVELDPQIAVVWREIVHGDADALAKMIEKYDVTGENVKATLAITHTTNLEKAFLTILRNRVNRGGILAPGAGLIKDGENGKGLKSRWYPETLARRIRDIAAYSDKLTFVEGDAFDAIAKFQDDPTAVFFVDPPYTAGGKKAGSRLYNNTGLDHKRLFEVSAAVRGDVLLTYDNAEEVKELTNKVGLHYKPVAMKSTHHAEMKELLIGKDLTWVR